MSACFVCEIPAVDERDGRQLCADHVAEYERLSREGLSEERENPIGAMWAGDSPEWTI